MTYTVTELTNDGSFFPTYYHGLTKEEAEKIAKELTENRPGRSEYFAEKEEH